MNSKRNAIRQDVVLCFCAAVAEKLRAIEKIVGRLLSKAGFYVFTKRQYRDGSGVIRVRVSSAPVRAPVERIDYLFLLPGGLRPDIVNSITSKTKVVGDVGTITRDSPKLREREAVIAELPLAARMKELNCGAHEPEALAGVTAALLGLSVDSEGALWERRAEDSEVSALKTAFHLGHALGVEMDEGVLVARYLRSNKKEILMDAGTALSLGTATGGCNFVTSHSPFPGALFDFYSDNALRFGAVVLRAEDERSALNMCIGAAYTGARGLLTTDGCFVNEVVETAALSETPLVVYAAPAEPAPGAMFRFRYGELPHAVYAPVSVESAFALGARAFATAEKFRTPVVLATDPYLWKIAYDVEPSLLDETGKKGKNVFEKLPGLVLDTRSKTRKDKYMEKLAALLDDSLPPKLFGDPLYQTLIVSWGSLQETLLEALRVAETQGRFDVKGVAVLSCEQLHPLPSQVETFLKQARRLIFVEHDGRFARFVQAETGCAPTDIVSKQDEKPFAEKFLSENLFSVEELVERLQNLFAPNEAASSETTSSSGKKEAVPPALPVLPIVAEFSALSALSSAAGERNGGESV
ncbi:MAG: hypothetical protein LBS00_03800 [Synergistaceae bacterium]|nr:hypothetical protein [Synergistaceae bacterium]